MKLHLDENGEASYWTMTRREFFATHRDQRNAPGRTGKPMRLALCPKTGGTCLVPVVLVPPAKVYWGEEDEEKP